MRRYVSDPTLPVSPVKDGKIPDVKSAPTPDAKPPTIYRTCIPIAVVAICLIILIVVALTSAHGHVAGGKTPQALVFIVEGVKATTMNAAMASNKMTNIQHLAEEGGIVASCPSSLAPTCARTQSGPRVSPYGAWSRLPGLASILTGVDSPKHNVYNDSSIQTFAQSSIPSFLKLAKARQVKIAMIGAPSIYSLGTYDVMGKSCSQLGLFDVECFGLGCGAVAPTCNMDSRYAYNSDQDPDVAFVAAAAMEEGFDVIVVHVQSPNLAALATQDYSEASYPYLSALYRMDALVGQLIETIVARTITANENWLSVVVSDHGGVSGAPGINTVDEDEVVGFAIGAYRNGLAIQLHPFVGVPRVFDVFPTVLRWLGVDYSNINVDGVVQGICSTGANPPLSCLN